MKSTVISILAFLYISMAGGVVLNLHFCMGALSSVEYGYDDHQSCGKCGMQEKDGCCNTELRIVKLDDSHQWVNSDSVKKKSFTLSLPAIDQFDFFTSRNHSVIRVFYHSPPDPRIGLVFLHNSVLLI